MKLVKYGSSHYVIVPVHVIRRLGWVVGDEVSCNIEDSSLVYVNLTRELDDDRF